MVLIQAGEEQVASGFKLLERFVVVPVQYGFLEELPKSLDKLEVGGIRRQKNQVAHDAALKREAASEAYKQASADLTPSIVQLFSSDLSALTEDERATLINAANVLIDASLVEERSAHALATTLQTSITQALSLTAGKALTPTFIEDAS